MSDAIRISEIFGPTIQGEGALIGRPTVFVRTGGCDFRAAIENNNSESEEPEPQGGDDEGEEDDDISIE